MSALSEPEISKRHLMTVDITEVFRNQKWTYVADVKGKKGTSTFVADNKEALAKMIVEEMWFFSLQAPIPNPFIV